MKIGIANPVYDTVFKFMMEDNAVARLLVSSIIGEKIISLEPRPQERTSVRVNAGGSTSITVYRLDFSAKIETPDGFKLVLIEMQKASYPGDIPRFRRYLGKQYASESSLITEADGKITALQIYSIFFLGKDLAVCDTPVLSIYPVVRDMGTGQVVKTRNEFIEALNHKCWIVQINCLKQRRRNDLEALLGVFDQENRSSDKHILNIDEEDFSPEYRPLIRRLQMAAGDVEVMEKMEVEDEALSDLKDFVRVERQEGFADGLKEGEAERNRLKAEKEAAQAEKEAAQAEKEAAQAREEAAQAKVKKFIFHSHDAGTPIETIAEMAELTVGEVLKILEERQTD